MYEHTDAVISNPWLEIEDIQEISIDEACVAIQKHWSAIARSHESLLAARKIFNSEKIVWPDQCDRFIEIFHSIEEHVQTFSDFLDEGMQFPYPLYIFRYPLMQKLHRLNVQLSEVCILMMKFRSLECHSSYNKQEQVQEIYQYLGTIMRTWRENKQQLHLLLAKSVATSTIKDPMRQINRLEGSRKEHTNIVAFRATGSRNRM